MSEANQDIHQLWQELGTPDRWLRDLEREKERVKAYLGLSEDVDLFRLLILAADQAVRKRQRKGRRKHEVQSGF